MIKTSLEQWQALKTVVDEGSFAKAAEKLNKSQSSVSYMLAQLQQRIPSQLFEEGGRKAVLTESGQMLYRHATDLLSQAEKLEKTADYLASGWEPEVTIAVDALVDLEPVFCALQHFSEQHPSTRIRLLETTLSGTDEAILSREADIAISPRIPPGFLGKPYAKVDMHAVAANTHPLAQRDSVTEDQLKLTRQIVVRDSGLYRKQDGGWLGAEQRWTVSHFSSSIKAVKAGLGFAFIPEALIKQELDNGTLLKLNLAQGGSRALQLHIVLTGQSYAGPAAKCVLEYLN